MVSDSTLWKTLKVVITGNIISYQSFNKKEEMFGFLYSLDIPTLSDTTRQQLEVNFTLEEVKSAIRSFPNGKACGPDGFGIKFYKAHINILAPLLLRMINDSITRGSFPDTLYDANICLLLKKGRDAGNANDHIGMLIHSDQTGFIPERYAFSNTRRLLNVLYTTKLPRAAVLSLEAQQAFDQIEWNYMICALQKFSFGDRFMTMIKRLYSRPKSCVIINNNRSTPFQLHRGTRQGCCLSPILFALALEPLAIAIRANQDIVGIKHGTSESIIGLYAHDVVLTLSDMEETIPPLLDPIKTFGQFSGFTINWEKSVLMPLSGNLNLQSVHNLPFKVAPDHLQYLGI
uniref:Reverse transcriptase domain-containing protein n=1 Tax=Oryzias sinensis TaxID=183150 RepID=A0A8C7X2D7_9TELE